MVTGSGDYYPNSARTHKKPAANGRRSPNLIP